MNEATREHETATTFGSGASGSTGDAPPAADHLARGTSVGRYVVLEHVGAGGMGDVYAAWDPELDRKLALKLLRAGREAGPGQARLLREAQALAKLSHPNVVAAYDGGTFAGRVFVAMEFVDGVTLSTHLAAGPRAWPEVLEIFMAVGRGLAAAHGAGLVHRDLKPDNIMIGDDGRVRVMDFGLARGPLHELGDTGEDEPGQPASALEARLTRAGARLGTPLYMAPEQWIGADVDARADQFSMCVALWEALFGERPFRGGSPAALMQAVTQGRPSPPSQPNRAPAWLRRAVERGLARAPEDRYASIDLLLAALASGRAGTRRRRLLAVAALTVGLGAAAVGAQRLERGRTIAACEAAGAEIAALWSDAARTSLREALVATGASHAGATFDRAAPWVDRWASAWSEARAQVCREAEVDGARPTAQYALATACLDEQRDQLAALLTALGEADAPTVARVVPAASSMPPPSSCLDPVILARRPAPPADTATRERVATLRRDLDRVKARSAAGRFPAALADAATVLTAAEAIGYAPLVVEARVAVGKLESKAKQNEAAEKSLTRAYVEAGTIGADTVAADAAIQLVYTVGANDARFAEGVQWGRSAEMLTGRLGELDGLDGAWLWSHLGSVYRVHGDFDEAIAMHTRALAIRRRELGEEHPEVGSALHNLANIHEARGALEEGLRVHAEALAILERALGPDHPHVALSCNSQAVLLERLGRRDEALALHERALGISERTLGPDHPNVAGSLFNMAIVHEARGDYDEAQRLYGRALAIREKTLGPDHPELAATLDSLAAIHLRRGELDAALGLRARALEISERALGPDHPDVAGWMNNLALVHEARGDRAAARPLLERALAVHERTFGPDHPHVAETLTNLADVRRDDGAHAEALALYERALAIWGRTAPEDPAQGQALLGLGALERARDRPAAAIAHLERALALRSTDETPPEDLAEARFALAQALAGDRPRALELAAQAAEGFREAGDARLAAVEAWSRAHAAR